MRPRADIRRKESPDELAYQDSIMLYPWPRLHVSPTTGFVVEGESHIF